MAFKIIEKNPTNSISLGLKLLLAMVPLTQGVLVASGTVQEAFISNFTLLSSCPFTPYYPPNAAANISATMCALFCYMLNMCWSLQIVGGVCKFSYLVVSPPQGGSTVGSQVYTTFTTGQYQDVIRGIIPTAGSNYNSSPPISTITSGVSCLLNWQQCWCSGVNRQISIDMGKTYTIKEMILTLPGGASNFTNVKIYVGNNGNVNDAVFAENMSLTAPVRYWFWGSLSGRYITVVDYQNKLPLCVCLLEAYGY